ncbi:MAG: ribulose-phosphate 3-epimerase [Legionellaceae bacterium]|nr:ribulose-phosphate 3-epimerase [Legionellaceae bacterium]
MPSPKISQAMTQDKTHDIIFPSLLAADSLRLGEEIAAVASAGIRTLHLDIMDNHYVPNLSFGPHVAQQIKQQYPELALDVHLMASPVDALIEAFAEAGAARISIHPEATRHLDRSLARIQALGCKAGLVLNPATSIESMRWCLHRLDFVLLMTVNPGFGNQAFISEMLAKIKILHETYPTLPITVDGGVSEQNIAALHRAGVTQFVIGSAIFKTKDYLKTITHMQKQIEK